MKLLNEGAEIEPGKLDAAIEERQRRSISFDKLCALGGTAWAEDIRNQIEPTIAPVYS